MGVQCAWKPRRVAHFPAGLSVSVPRQSVAGQFHGAADHHRGRFRLWPWECSDFLQARAEDGSGGFGRHLCGAGSGCLACPALSRELTQWCRAVALRAIPAIPAATFFTRIPPLPAIGALIGRFSLRLALGGSMFAAYFLVALGHGGLAGEADAAFFVHAQAFDPDF